jgi:hypothetical protein
MTAYLVTYDLNKQGKDYSGLIAELQRSPKWWKRLKSTFIILTNETPQQIWDRIKSHVDSDDYVLIIQCCDNVQGWLPKEDWDWIHANVPNCR